MAHDQHPKPNLPCTPADTHAFLAEAEALVASRGQKLTSIRRKVLELLLDAEGPAKAYDLLDRLDGEGSAKPPTVYRALDFLQQQGLAHKIESLNAYVACGHTSHAHSALFLICDACGSAEELHSVSTSAALEHETASAGFSLSRAVVEARGVCRTCDDGGGAQS
ncbi:MAG: transcriptional repressor [Pseudomonadota bacterium]